MSSLINVIALSAIGVTGAGAGLSFTWSCVTASSTLSSLCGVTLPQNRAGPTLTVDSSKSVVGSESVLTVRNNVSVYLTCILRYESRSYSHFSFSRRLLYLTALAHPRHPSRLSSSHQRILWSSSARLQ